MRDINAIIREDREKAMQCAARAAKPAVFTAQDIDQFKRESAAGYYSEAVRGIPFFGDYVPDGWEVLEELFVDTSGFGSEGEPALTYDQFVNRLEAGKGYALHRAGQFQINVKVLGHASGTVNNTFGNEPEGELHPYYAEFNNQLQGRNSQRRKLANNTYLIRRGEDIAVLLHGTDIVTVTPSGEVTVDTGGWNTLTTRDRMNRYLPGGYHVRTEQLGKAGWDEPVARVFFPDGVTAKSLEDSVTFQL